MPPKRLQQPKDNFCKSCRKWFTANRIGKHVLYCTKWDLAGQTSEPESPQPGNSTDEAKLTDEILLSSDDTSSQPDSDHYQAPGATSLLAFDEAPPYIDDIPANDAMQVDDETNPALEYQQEHVYDNNEDDEWWNEFCVPEPDGLFEEDEQDTEDFEEILNWINNEFDLEVAQNSESSRFACKLNLIHFQCMNS